MKLFPITRYTASTPLTLTLRDFAFDPTAAFFDTLTWGSGAGDVAWTFDVSGTNPTMTAGDGLMTFSHAVTVDGISRLDGGVGIGVDPSVSFPFNLLGNQNGQINIKAKNANAGTGAFARFQAVNDGTVAVNMRSNSSGFSGTKFGQSRADTTEVLGRGGVLMIGTVTTGKDLIFGTEDLLAMTIDGSNQNIKIEKNLTVNNLIISDDGFIGSASDPDAIQIEASGDIIMSQGLTVDTDTLVVDADNDKVGIGTASPNAPLEVKGLLPGEVGGYQSGLLHVTNADDSEFANAVITGHNSDGGNTQLWYLGSTTGSNNNIAFINRQNGSMAFRTNDTERFKIEAGGNVVISEQLILGTAGVFSSQFIIESVSGNAMTLHSDDAAILDILISTSTTSDATFNVSISKVGDNLALQRNAGDILIGTTSTDGKLTIVGDDGSTPADAPTTLSVTGGAGLAGPPGASPDGGDSGDFTFTTLDGGTGFGAPFNGDGGDGGNITFVLGDGGLALGSGANGVAGCFRVTTPGNVEFVANTIKLGDGTTNDVVTQWITAGGTGILHYNNAGQRWEFDHTVFITSGFLDVINGGIFAGDDSQINGDLDVFGNLLLTTDGLAADLTMKFTSDSDTGILTWFDSGSSFQLSHDIVFQGDVDIESGDLCVIGISEFGVGGNTVTISADGVLTMAGTARVQKHIIIKAETFKLGATAPTAAIIGNFSVLQFTGTGGTVPTIYTSFHIPPDWAVGTDIEVHVHWAPTNTNAGTVVWQLTWDAVASEADELISGAGTTISVLDATQTIQDELLETANMIISGGSLAAMDMIGMCVFRDPSHGSDDYGSAASFVLIEIHYISDKLGEAT